MPHRHEPSKEEITIKFPHQRGSVRFLQELIGLRMFIPWRSYANNMPFINFAHKIVYQKDVICEPNMKYCTVSEQWK